MGLFEFLGVLFAVVSIITFFIGRHQGRKENKALHAKMDKMKGELRDELSDDLVDTANAQLRVKDGGKVVKREKKVSADIERRIHENITTSETVVAVKKTVRNMDEQVDVGDSLNVEVKRANKDYKIKTQNIKTFTVDAILVNEEDKKEEKSKSEDDDSSQDNNQQDSKS